MTAELKSKLNLEHRVALQEVIPLETPFLIYVDPSSACNFRCQFCPTGHKDIIKESEYRRSVMNFDLFKKMILELGEFDQPIKVLRMNKIGEPLLNKNLPKMIEFAKSSGFVKYIDLATNGALFSHDLLVKLLGAGLDRINISLEGINREQYLEHAKVDIDFSELVENIQWLHSNKQSCEITIKIPGNYLTDEQKIYFFELFQSCCDRIFVEDIAPIWPSFDVEKRAGIKLKNDVGQYQRPLEKKEVCTYIFYAMAVNADATVSACCPDWNQQLIIGNIREKSVKDIWNSKEMNTLRIQHLEGNRFKNDTCRQCGHVDYAQVDNIDLYKSELLQKMINHDN
ncbi:MAG: radical SAM protein [Thiotrichaceae bacterium IS1]|nr:MAG: radical SAM protein [Thiotrichaceae bacterium IS1]